MIIRLPIHDYHNTCFHVLIYDSKSNLYLVTRLQSQIENGMLFNLIVAVSAKAPRKIVASAGSSGAGSSSAVSPKTG